MHVKELYAILIALGRWAPVWRNKKVNIFTDNNIALACISKGLTKCLRSTPILQELYWIIINHNISVTAIRVDSKDNILADALSRMSNISYYIKASQLLHDWDMLCRNVNYVCDPLYHMTSRYLSLLFQSWNMKSCSWIKR